MPDPLLKNKTACNKGNTRSLRRRDKHKAFPHGGRRSAAVLPSYGLSHFRFPFCDFQKGASPDQIVQLVIRKKEQIRRCPGICQDGVPAACLALRRKGKIEIRFLLVELPEFFRRIPDDLQRTLIAPNCQRHFLQLLRFLFLPAACKQQHA